MKLSGDIDVILAILLRKQIKAYLNKCTQTSHLAKCILLRTESTSIAKMLGKKIFSLQTCIITCIVLL